MTKPVVWAAARKNSLRTQDEEPWEEPYSRHFYSFCNRIARVCSRPSPASIDQNLKTLFILKEIAQIYSGLFGIWTQDLPHP